MWNLSSGQPFSRVSAAPRDSAWTEPQGWGTLNPASAAALALVLGALFHTPNPHLTYSCQPKLQASSR